MGSIDQTRPLVAFSMVGGLRPSGCRTGITGVNHGNPVGAELQRNPKQQKYACQVVGATVPYRTDHVIIKNHVATGTAYPRAKQSNPRSLRIF